MAGEEFPMGNTMTGVFFRIQMDGSGCSKSRGEGGHTAVPDDILVCGSSEGLLPHT